MPQKKKTSQPQRIAAAALALAEKDGWGGIYPGKTAKKAKLPVAAVTRAFPDVWALLLHILGDLDAQVEAEAETSGAAWRDDLFEILMARFDLMQAHRSAYAAILPALLKAPQTAPRFAKRHLTAMQRMLEQAEAPATPIHAAALGAMYLALADTWKKDESPDLSKTMAAVDKALGGFERFLSPCSARTGS
jgi:DNA-binding transcriptional regulator YbjK